MADQQQHPFIAWLTTQRRGMSLGDLDDAFTQLVEAVSTHGKRGVLTLKVTVNPAGKGIADQVTVTDDITVKAPQPDRAESLYFVTPDNALSRHDPRQLQFLREENPQ